MKTNEILLALTIKHKGEWNKTYQDLQNKIFPSEEEIEQAKTFCESNGIKYLTITDPTYPKYLFNTPTPPFVLFYKGNIDLIENNENNVCVVGSRTLNDYNQSALAKVISSEETKGKTIVASATKGVGKLAIEQALLEHKPVIVFKDEMIECDHKNDNLYNQVLEQNGLVITTKPNGELEQTDFAQKYVRMAGISHKVIVSAIEKHSGAHITINTALAMGKDICVIPQPYGSELANNTLIAEGAFIIC